MGTIQSNDVIYWLCAKSNIWGHCIEIYLNTPTVNVWRVMGMGLGWWWYLCFKLCIRPSFRLRPESFPPNTSTSLILFIFPLLISQLPEACCGLTLSQIPKFESLTNLLLHALVRHALASFGCQTMSQDCVVQLTWNGRDTKTYTTLTIDHTLDCEWYVTIWQLFLHQCASLKSHRTAHLTESVINQFYITY